MHAPNQFQQPLHAASLGKRALQGAAIALVLIAVFLLNAGAPDPRWPKFWMIRPLLVVPAAGAVGGIFYYFMDYLRYQGGWKKAVAILASLLVYLVGLWVGTVLGLVGTMWD
ncbi:potassium transporter KefB [Hymenobacter crusticola]|uniref:Potassium transporter KefB n=1 Tax=Hymenobacter crusticola TaxID=1770526 RepID=A0A243WEC8_9BACT|nr:potassium transporter KefB [Hymenobacter crusticola]OUJ74063.1 potassium transporter KefB [Hymenobacter crusticola]